jgi:hypothetical protein
LYCMETVSKVSIEIILVKAARIFTEKS